MKPVYIHPRVVEGLLAYAKSCHPKEGILLLRGRRKRDRLVVEELVIPPLPTHGEGFSSFPTHMLPLDLSILGIAHSHPSGNPTPSTQDLLNFYGLVMAIITYPYRRVEDIHLYDREGNRLPLHLLEEG